MDLTKTKPSFNFEDRTNDDLSKIDWITQLGMRAFGDAHARDPNNPTYTEATKGLSPDALRELLFKKVMDEYSVRAMQDFSKWPHENPLFPQIGPTGFRKYPR